MELDPAEIRRHLDEARRAPTADAQGKTYEELVAYLFGLVPRANVRRNIIGPFKVEQIDVAVGHPRTDLHQLPHSFLIECKNWTRPVDSMTVGYFFNILANRNMELGILVAANGITSSDDDIKFAHALGMSAMPRGHRMIVITDADLLSLRTMDDFYDMLNDRFLMTMATGTIGMP
ncbi:restriction endonuclease [Frankia sp. R82]|uniref:restriction endonuclease n=1 Tax=Frankia sp. R82 TaxID=2950553 RepID=UPI002044BBA0|nr:restriction endonuclease [Frankia sp. R82]MCM3883167.1 restriction endonuclease [Frankia sp. R82]